MGDLIEKLLQKLENGTAVELVSVVEASGSTPRGAGALLAVFADGTATGTVGGGNVEFEATKLAKELVARVKAVLRRYQPSAAVSVSAAHTDQQGEFVEYPDLIVNLTNYSVIYRGHSVDMPPKELELLYFLASSPNQVFTREQLLDHIWGYEYIGDTRTVDVHVKRLREKLEGVSDQWSLKTVWGVGYKFEVL